MASNPLPAPPPRKLSLPVSMVTPSDVGRQAHELEVLENDLLQLSIQKTDHGQPVLAFNKGLEKLAEHNRLNLATPADRQTLMVFLVEVKQGAPVLHISFNSEPGTLFLDKLVLWLRREIHPLVLLTIGLQPAIGAGCMVRTTNKYFDLSMRQTFIAKRPLLLEQIIPAVNETQPA
jgi:hypothetical protein